MIDPVDDTETVFVTRAMLIAGMLVGIGGEHDDPPSDVQLERAADLIMRAGRRREAALNKLVTKISMLRSD